MRRSTIACGLLLALALACATAATGASDSVRHVAARHLAAHTRQHARAARTLALERARHYYGKELRAFRRETWYWQRVMGVTRTRTRVRELESTSLERLRRLDEHWRRLQHRVWVRAHHPPHLASWLCIHRYEGSWTDGDGPYYGGLQMDLSFQASYGRWLLARKGTANHWTPLEQIWTAEKASRVRGFWPWPNSARFCGLL